MLNDEWGFRMIEESGDFSVLRNQDSRGRQEVNVVDGGITWSTLNGSLSLAPPGPSPASRPLRFTASE